MPAFPPRLATALLLLLPACQVLPGGDSAVDVGAKVYASDRGEGIKAVWVVNARTGRKLEPLMEGASREFRIRFSPGKEWLAVEDDVLESFSTVRLFHQESVGGFRRVPDEEFILGPWRKFLRRHGLAESDVASSASTVESWSDDGKQLRLVLKAVKHDGRVLEDRVQVDLAGLE